MQYYYLLKHDYLCMAHILSEISDFEEYHRAAGNCLGESLMPQATVLTCADSGEGGKLT